MNNWKDVDLEEMLPKKYKVNDFKAEDPEVRRIKNRRKQLSKMLDESTLEELLKLAIDVAAEKSVNLKRQAQELIDTADTMSRRIGRKDIN